LNDRSSGVPPGSRRQVAADFPSVSSNSGFEPRSIVSWTIDLRKHLLLVACLFAYVGRNGQPCLDEHAVYDFFRALVVLDMNGAAPARELATQEVGVASNGILLVLGVKGLQEEGALLNQAVDGFGICYEVHVILLSARATQVSCPLGGECLETKIPVLPSD
jgi:hypothetical protein